MKRAFFYTSTIWLLLWAQIATNQLSAGTVLGIPWVLSTVLFFGLSRGPLVGQLMGLSLGLLLDASVLGLFGLNAFLLALTGYASGMLRRQVDGVKPWTQFILTGVTAVLFVCAFAGLDHMFSRSPRPLGWGHLLHPILQALLAPLIFLLMKRWVEFWGVYRWEQD